MSSQQIQKWRPAPKNSSTISNNFTGFEPLSVRQDGTSARGESFENIIESIAGFGSGAISILVVGSRISHKEFTSGWKVITLNRNTFPTCDFRPTAAQMINIIKDKLGLSMAALAKILNVARASLYNWLENEPRDDEVIERVEMLYEIANRWKEKNPFHYPPGKLLKENLGNGPSMAERLGRRELDRGEIEEGMNLLLELMKIRRKSMDKAKAISEKSVIDSDSRRETLERLTGSVSLEP